MRKQLGMTLAEMIIAIVLMGMRWWHLPPFLYLKFATLHCHITKPEQLRLDKAICRKFWRVVLMRTVTLMAVYYVVVRTRLPAPYRPTLVLTLVSLFPKTLTMLMITSVVGVHQRRRVNAKGQTVAISQIFWVQVVKTSTETSELKSVWHMTI